MKSYKKRTILGALVGGVFGVALTAGAIAFASPHGPHGRGHHWTPEKIDEHLTEMTERLNLSEAQEAQIRTAMEQAQARLEEIKEMPRGAEKFAAFRDLHFTTEDQIYANLTCAQREELRLLKRDHRVERMHKRWEHHQAADTE